MKALLFIIFLLSFSFGADLKGSKDHPLVGRFSGSQIIGYDFREYDEFVIPLGPQTRNKKGRIVLSKSIHVEGKVTRILYLTPKGASTLQVIRSYERALKKKGFKTLFTCSKNSCGNLFNYAPTFSNELYEYTITGGMSDQRYISMKLTDRGREVYVSIYAFRHEYPHNRFKKRVLVQVDVIESGELKENLIVSAKDIEKGIKEEGHVALYGIYFDTDSYAIKPESEPTLREIVLYLEKNPDVKLFVVGHTDNRGTYRHNLNLSQRRAEAVVEWLVKKGGVDRSRLIPVGVGPVAPVSTNLTEEGRAKNRRVELVLQ